LNCAAQQLRDVVKGVSLAGGKMTIVSDIAFALLVVCCPGGAVSNDGHRVVGVRAS